MFPLLLFHDVIDKWIKIGKLNLNCVWSKAIDAFACRSTLLSFSGMPIQLEIQQRSISPFLKARGIFLKFFIFGFCELAWFKAFNTILKVNQKKNKYILTSQILIKPIARYAAFTSVVKIKETSEIRIISH